MDRFIQAYLECAAWSSTDENGTSLDALPNPWAPEAIAQAEGECSLFRKDTWARGADANSRQGGHDFWLTRNRHGAGYWDGDWPEDTARILTDVSHAAGERDVYIGDDGMLYFSPGV